MAYAVSAERKSLADVSGFTAASKLLLRLHGAFMVAAWIGTASIGILLARYFRQTWVNSQLCGKDHWFAVSFKLFNINRVWNASRPLPLKLSELI